MTVVEPDWVRHALWWHVYPLGLVGADTTGRNRSAARTLAQLEPWLDYAVRLGASGLALGPIFRSHTHGYDTIDHFAIDERLGTGDDFAALVGQCHDRGLRLLLDGVFNHVGPGFEVGGRPVPPSWLATAPDGSTATFEGHAGLLALDHAHPAVAEHVGTVMDHWLDAGADGWRLDAAYTVPREFWARTVPAVRARHGQAYFVGEVIHGDYTGFVAESGLDAVTQYELWKAIWSALNDRNLYELAYALGRHDDFVRAFAPLTFVGNHDVTRLASRLEDPGHLGHALAVLFTVGGTPSVYYGDEQGFRGIKQDRVGGDDAVRPQLPEDPSQLAPFGAPVLRTHQQLIGLRRRHPWLHRATTETVLLSNTALAFRSVAGDRHLVTVLNVGDQPVRVEVAGTTAILCGSEAAAAERSGDQLTVPRGQWAIAH